MAKNVNQSRADSLSETISISSKDQLFTPFGLKNNTKTDQKQDSANASYISPAFKRTESQNHDDAEKISED